MKVFGYQFADRCLAANDRELDGGKRWCTTRFVGLLLVILIAVSACGVGQFFIKRSILNLESDIAKELKSYARFNDQQELAIEQIAAQTARLVRAERLPVLVSELDKLASDFESKGQLSEQNWATFTAFMEDPFELSGEEEFLDSITAVVFAMSEDQIKQAQKKLSKDYAKEKRELAKRTDEDQADDIVGALKAIFSELGIKRTRAQLEQAKLTLTERKSYLEFYRKVEDEQYQRFSSLLSDRGESETDFRNRFKQAWVASDQSPKETMPGEWAHNFEISLSVMNSLMDDLNLEQRSKSAAKIREYAALFEELSRVN